LRAQHLILNHLLNLHDVDVVVVPHIFILELFLQVFVGLLVFKFGHEGRVGREHVVELIPNHFHVSLVAQLLLTLDQVVPVFLKHFGYV